MEKGDQLAPPTNWWQGAFSTVQTVATKSVVTSIQWIVGMITVAFISSMWLNPVLSEKVFWLLCAAVIFFGSIYVAWMFAGPNRLQSEKHIKEMKQLDLQVIGDDRLRDQDLPKVINAEPVANSAPEVLGFTSSDTTKGGPDA